MENSLKSNLKWGKIIPIIMNILSAFAFFLAYYFRPNEWFIVAAVVNIIVAVLIYLLFTKVEKRFEKIINRPKLYNENDGKEK